MKKQELFIKKLVGRRCRHRGGWKKRSRLYSQRISYIYLDVLCVAVCVLHAVMFDGVTLLSILLKKEGWLKGGLSEFQKLLTSFFFFEVVVLPILI
jgi:hypothetical protein